MNSQTCFHPDNLICKIDVAAFHSSLLDNVFGDIFDFQTNIEKSGVKFIKNNTWVKVLDAKCQINTKVKATVSEITLHPSTHILPSIFNYHFCSQGWGGVVVVVEGGRGAQAYPSCSEAKAG